MDLLESRSFLDSPESAFLLSLWPPQQRPGDHRFVVFGLILRRPLCLQLARSVLLLLPPQIFQHVNCFKNQNEQMIHQTRSLKTVVSYILFFHSS